jgi:hypothetical protein
MHTCSYKRNQNLTLLLLLCILIFKYYWNYWRDIKDNKLFKERDWDKKFKKNNFFSWLRD